MSEMDSVDFGNIESLKKLFLKLKMKYLLTELENWYSSFKIEYLVIHGGFMRGESWVIGALQHNFKSGF